MQRLIADQASGRSFWHIDGLAPFPASDRKLCAKHGVPCLPTVGDLAITYASSWIEVGMADDMVECYANDLANESNAVIERLAALATPENRLALLVEAAKDLIEIRHREATADYACMDARAEGYAAIRG